MAPAVTIFGHALETRMVAAKLLGDRDKKAQHRPPVRTLRFQSVTGAVGGDGFTQDILIRKGPTQS